MGWMKQIHGGVDDCCLYLFSKENQSWHTLCWTRLTPDIASVPEVDREVGMEKWHFAVCLLLFHICSCSLCFSLISPTSTSLPSPRFSYPDPPLQTLRLINTYESISPPPSLPPLHPYISHWPCSFTNTMCVCLCVLLIVFLWLGSIWDFTLSAPPYCTWP